jgi:5-formyltetrahydrofolate cyclo-ligase
MHLFRSWEPELTLDKDHYGIDVPQDNQPQCMPDIVIVPLLAFDKKGYRLGYGAGYYDQTLSVLRESRKNIQIIGAAYSMQQVDAIPFEDHDQKLDAVVTEKEVIRFT